MSIWTAYEYGGAAVWPAFATGGLATAVGVFLALVVEREVSRRRDAELAVDTATREEEQRRSEARLAFGALAEELGTLETSLGALRTGLPTARYAAVELPTGSWRAVDERLGQIIGDFELLSAIARVYGRIDDVHRGMSARDGAALVGRSEMVTAATEAVREVIDSALVGVGELRPRVAAQISAPTIRV